MIVDLHLKNRLVIVVGSGNEGLKKINSLLTQNCSILVIAPNSSPHIQKLVDEGSIEFIQKRLDDVEFLTHYDPILIMATTNDKQLNKKIINKAQEMNCYAYASDDPSVSDFSHPSVINLYNTIQIAVSTGGKSPALAREISNRAKKIFDNIITLQDIDMIELQSIARKEAKNFINTQQERKKFLYTVLNDSKIKQLISMKDQNGAKKRMYTILGKWK